MARLSYRPCILLLLAGCPAPVAGLSDSGSSSSGDGTTTGMSTTGAEVPTGGGSGGSTATGATGEPASSGEGSTAAPEPICGDGVVAGDELCDDGVDAPDAPDDGCDATCQPQAVVLWTQSWDSGAKKDDNVDGLAVDAAGNIYVAGSTTDAAYQADAIVRKLDPGGAELLRIDYVGAAGLDDVARSVAVDADGSIYAAGFEQVAETVLQGWVRKYDPAGKQLWVHERVSEVVDGSGIVNTVVLDGDAVYIVGSEDVGDKDTTQFFLQRLASADGKPVWTSIVGDAVALFKIGLAVDPDGELLVAGGIVDAMGDRQPWVGKYSAAGEQLWSRSDYLIGGGLAMAAAAGPGGELAVTGVGFQFNDFNIWLASLDGSGGVVWEDFINGDGDDIGYSLAFGAGGELYIGGFVNIKSHMSDTLLRRYTSAGLPYWTSYHNDEVDLYDAITAVVVTPAMVVAAGSEFVLGHGSNQWIRAHAP